VTVTVSFVAPESVTVKVIELLPASSTTLPS
jgi:hypothetical protein